MKEEKVFCGSGKQQTDRWMKITINPVKIMPYIQEYEGHKFVKLNINLKTEPDKYGKDVEVTVDTWRPRETNGDSKPAPTKNIEVDNNDDLPF